jgi:hypothetical protein
MQLGRRSSYESKPDEISIARRADVVALDSFVGPKT